MILVDLDDKQFEARVGQMPGALNASLFEIAPDIHPTHAPRRFVA
jgi:hypothetical protein